MFNDYFEITDNSYVKHKDKLCETTEITHIRIVVYANQ